MPLARVLLREGGSPTPELVATRSRLANEQNAAWRCLPRAAGIRRHAASRQPLRSDARARVPLHPSALGGALPTARRYADGALLCAWVPVGHTAPAGTAHARTRTALQWSRRANTGWPPIARSGVGETNPRTGLRTSADRHPLPS